MSSQIVYFNNPDDITKLQGQVGSIAGSVETNELSAYKIIGNSATPTVSFTGSTGAYDLTVVGNDTAGKIIFKLDENFTDGVLFNLDFSTPYTNIPVVTFSSARPDTAYINYSGLLFVITSTTGFQLIVDGSAPLTLPPGGLLDVVFNYQVIGK